MMDWRIFSRDYMLRGLRGLPPQDEVAAPSPLEMVLLIVMDAIMFVTVAVFWLLSRLPIVDSLLETSVRCFSRGALGYFLRGAYYKNKLRRMGKNVMIDVGAIIWFPENVEIGDHCHIDINVIVNGGGKGYGYVRIGNCVRVTYGGYIAGRGGVEIQDYVGIAGQTAIFSASNYYRDPARPEFLVEMTGMVPASEQYVIEKPVVVESHVSIGLHCIILPGVKVGHHAVVGANSLVVRDVAPLTVVAGTPVRVIGRRGAPDRAPAGSSDRPQA